MYYGGKGREGREGREGKGSEGKERGWGMGGEGNNSVVENALQMADFHRVKNPTSCQNWICKIV